MLGVERKEISFIPGELRIGGNVSWVVKRKQEFASWRRISQGQGTGCALRSA